MSALASWVAEVIRNVTRRPAEALSAVFIGVVLCSVWRRRTDGLAIASSTNNGGGSKKRKCKKVSGIKVKSSSDGLVISCSGAAVGARLEGPELGSDDQNRQSGHLRREATTINDISTNVVRKSPRNNISTCDEDVDSGWEDQNKNLQRKVIGGQSPRLRSKRDSERSGQSLSVYKVREDDDNSDLSTKCNASSGESESSLLEIRKYAPKDKATEAWEKFFDLTGKLIENLEASVKKFRIEAREIVETGGFDFDSSADSSCDERSTVEAGSSGVNNGFFEGVHQDSVNEDRKEKSETLVPERTKSEDIASKVLSDDFEEMSNALRKCFLDITRRKLLDAYDLMVEKRDLNSGRSRPGMDGNNSEYEKEVCAEETDTDNCLEHSHKSDFSVSNGLVITNGENSNATSQELDENPQSECCLKNQTVLSSAETNCFKGEPDVSETEPGKLEQSEGWKVDSGIDHEETRSTSNFTDTGSNENVLDACDMLLSLTEKLNLSHVVFNGIPLYGYFATCSYKTKLIVSNLLRAKSKVDALQSNTDSSSENNVDKGDKAFYSGISEVVKDFFKTSWNPSSEELLKEGPMLNYHIPVSDARQGNLTKEYREPEFEYLLDGMDDSGELECLLDSSNEEPNGTEDEIKSCTISYYKLPEEVKGNTSISSLDNELEDQDESRDFEVKTVRIISADLLNLEAVGPVEVKESYDPFRPWSTSPKGKMDSWGKLPSLEFEDSFMVNNQAVADGEKVSTCNESVTSEANVGELVKDSEGESCAVETDRETGEVNKCNEMSDSVESLRVDLERLNMNAKAKNVKEESVKVAEDQDGDDDDDDDVKKGNELDDDSSGGKDGGKKGMQKDENSPEEQPGEKEDSAQNSGGSGSSGGGEDRKGDENSDGKKEKEESSEDEEKEDDKKGKKCDDETDDNKNKEVEGSTELVEKVDQKDEITVDSPEIVEKVDQKDEKTVDSPEIVEIVDDQKDENSEESHGVEKSVDDQKDKKEGLEIKVSKDDQVGSVSSNPSSNTEDPSDSSIERKSEDRSRSFDQERGLKKDEPSTSSAESEPDEIEIIYPPHLANASDPIRARKDSFDKQNYPLLLKQLESDLPDKDNQKTEHYKELFQAAMKEIESRTDEHSGGSQLPRTPEKRKSPTKVDPKKVEDHPKGLVESKKRKVTTPEKEKGEPTTPTKPKTALDVLDNLIVESLLSPKKSGINVGASCSKTQDVDNSPKHSKEAKKKSTEKIERKSKIPSGPRNAQQALDDLIIQAVCADSLKTEDPKINVGASGSKDADIVPPKAEEHPKGPTKPKKRKSTETQETTGPLPIDLTRNSLPKTDSDNEVEPKN